MSEDKERAVAQLRKLEAEERDRVAAAREQVDRGKAPAGTIARIIRTEGRADGLATAVDVVQGVPF